MKEGKSAPLAERLLRALQAARTPLDKVALTKQAGLRPEDRAAVREALRQLEATGEIVAVRDRWALPAASGIYAGQLEFRGNGSAYLVGGPEGQEEIDVAANLTANALPGDKVQVQADKGPREPGAKLTGRVIGLVERARRPIVGTLALHRGKLDFTPDSSRFPHAISLRPAAPQLKPRAGDKVVVELDDWKSRTAPLTGRIVEILGRADDPGLDLISIIRRFQLPTEFPEAVLTEAQRIPERMTAADRAGREDLRQRAVFTIDPDDARDFDDAIEVEDLPRGAGWRLHVHIADVAHFVRPGSALDKEARRRGNSVYLPDRVLPMLPERLSNGVCSLMPQVDRCVFSAFLDIAPDGAVRRVRFGRSAIHSQRRFTYGEAMAVLEGPREADDWSRHLHRAWDCAAALRTRRFRQGALDLEMPEVKVRCDEHGRPVSLEQVQHDRSHQLIEECMLAANDAVAHALKNAGIPTIYRIHEDPDPEKLETLRDLIRAHGHKAGDLTKRAEIQKVLERVRGTPEEPVIKISLLRSLKRAAYRTAPIGHYGLAKPNYAHFTSPIRRYADLIVHRSLAQLLRLESGALRGAELKSAAQHISETERIAAEAEREAVKLKKFEFLTRAISSRQTFTALVMEAHEYGLHVELEGLGLGGRLYARQMGNEYFQFDHARRAMRGTRSKRLFTPGQRLPVRIHSVDADRHQIDFALAETDDAPATPKEKQGQPLPPSRGSQNRRPRGRSEPARKLAPDATKSGKSGRRQRRRRGKKPN
ncbi:MAG: ribonuclease R [Verrucomicrobia bacterium]|nr:ribonuclease R [Verrucomicrobiota bacterium]